MKLNNNKITLYLFGFVLVFFPIQPFASTSKWKGEIELGFVATRGNTDTQSLNTKSTLIYSNKKWRHTGKFGGLKKSSESETIAKRYRVSAKSEYKLSEYKYTFVKTSFDDDRFSGYDYQLSGSIGAGYRFKPIENLTLDLEAGLGGRRSKQDNKNSNDERIIRGASELTWDISNTSTFTESVSSEIGEDSTITRSISTLEIQIIGSLALKLSATIRYNSKVPDNTDKTDTETALTFAYKF